MSDLESNFSLFIPDLLVRFNLDFLNNNLIFSLRAINLQSKHCFTGAF